MSAAVDGLIVEVYYADMRKQHAEILKRLEKLYPKVRCALQFETVFQLLVATILSAQCTDKRVNLVTPALFARFPDAEEMAGAQRGEIEKYVRSTGFYRNKAKHIQGAARALVERFDGRVPDTMSELLTLPGVARKTANVILGVGYGKEEGVCVDTHVGRLSQRLGLSRNASPVKIEQDLMKIVPLRRWNRFSLQLIQHGREVCFARKPRCEACVLASVCPSAFTFNGKKISK